MVFAKNFARNYEKHQTLGQWDNHPSDPAYYIEDCRILRDHVKTPKTMAG